MLTFYGLARIVICTTICTFVSQCGLWRPLLLARLHCYVAHFNCEQELNSTCSRSFLDQHTRWYRDALLSNARLTFTPLKVSRHSPPSPESGAPPQFHCGERSIRAAMTAIHTEVSIPCQLHPDTSTSPSVTPARPARPRGSAMALAAAPRSPPPDPRAASRPPDMQRRATTLTPTASSVPSPPPPPR